jgi:hypothetical protein
MRFFNPLAVAFAVDTVISVNRIFLFSPSGAHRSATHRAHEVILGWVHHGSRGDWTRALREPRLGARFVSSRPQR